MLAVKEYLGAVYWLEIEQHRLRKGLGKILALWREEPVVTTAEYRENVKVKFEYHLGPSQEQVESVTLIYGEKRTILSVSNPEKFANYPIGELP